MPAFRRRKSEDKNVKLKDSGIKWIGKIPEHWEVKRLKDVCGFINRGTSPIYDETGSYKVVNQATFSKGFWDESSLRFTKSFEVKPRGLLKEDDILAQGSTNQTELQKDWLLAFFICIPPQPEQDAIATYLDEKTQKIDSILSNQTISRVDRTTKYKNDCKIIDFSYKNVNVRNIKIAFEHFSNVVVSDFDPIGDESKLEIFYTDLAKHEVFIKHSEPFARYKKGDSKVSIIMDMEDGFADFINSKPKEAKELKSKISHFFQILNLIEYVIELDEKSANPYF